MKKTREVTRSRKTKKNVEVDTVEEYKDTEEYIVCDCCGLEWDEDYMPCVEVAINPRPFKRDLSLADLNELITAAMYTENDDATMYPSDSDGMPDWDSPQNAGFYGQKMPVQQAINWEIRYRGSRLLHKSYHGSREGAFNDFVREFSNPYDINGTLTDFRYHLEIPTDTLFDDLKHFCQICYEVVL